MRSWSKWKIFSRKWKSSSSDGPRSAALRVFWSSATGMPCWVVRRGRSPPATWWVSPPGRVSSMRSAAVAVSGAASTVGSAAGRRAARPARTLRGAGDGRGRGALRRSFRGHDSPRWTERAELTQRVSVTPLRRQSCMFGRLRCGVKSGDAPSNDHLHQANAPVLREDRGRHRLLEVRAPRRRGAVQAVRRPRRYRPQVAPERPSAR